MTDDREKRTEDRKQRKEKGGGKSAGRGSASVIRRLVKWGLLSVGSLLLLIILLWGVLQTPWAKSRLAGLIADITSKTEDYQVRMKGLDGLLPFSITLKEAEISDKNGPWLKMDDFDFAMKPQDLIWGRVDVKWLKMKHLIVSRLPEAHESEPPPKKPPQESTLPSLPSILVQEVSLERIDIGEALTGRPMRFSLNSRAETAHGNVSVSADLKDLNSTDNAFTLKAVYDLKKAYLTADTAYHEAPGGLVAAFSGLKDLEGIELSATAKGPVSNIKGQLHLRVDGYGNAVLQYDISKQKAVTLKLNGQITADARVVPPQLAQMITSEQVDLALNASISPENEILVDPLRIKNGDVIISLEGTADLKKEKMDMQARIEGVNPSPFLKGTGISLEAPAPIRISAAGPFMGPDVSITTSLAGMKTQEADLSDATLKIRASLMEGFTGLKSASVAVNAQGLRVQQAPKLKGPLNIHMDAQSPDFSTWQVKELVMTLPGIDVNVKEALMALTEGSFSGDLQVYAANIAPLLPPDTLGVDGMLHMDAKVKGSGPDDLTAQLNLALSRLTGLPPEAADLAGPKVTLTARAELQGDRLKLESVDLLGSQAHLASSGWLDIKNGTFDVAYEMGLDSSGNGLSKAKELPVGDMESKGKIAGAFDNFSAQVALVSKKLQINDLEVNDMNVRLKASGLPQKPTGDIHLKASAMDQPLSVNSDFAWSGKTLSVKDARVQVPGIDLGAAIEFNPETESPSGRIKGQVTSLALLQALTGVVAKGQGTFQIEAYKAAISGNSTSVKLDADFNDLKYQDYGAATLKMRAQVDDIKKMQGRASLKATDIPLGKSQLETFDLDAKGSLSDAEITLSTKGTSRTEAENTSGAPLFLSTKVRAGRTNLWRLHLDSLKGGYENLSVILQKPATLTYDDDGRISMDNLQLKTDKGLIQATAKMDQESLTARISITDLPLSLLEPFVGQDLEGKVALNLDISGPLADPGMRVAIHVKEYKIMGQDMKKPILLNAKLNSRRDGDRLLADLELSGLGNTPFKANGSIPAHISLRPFAFDMNKSGNVEGKLLGKFDLAFLQTLPTMSDQNLQGKVDIDMGIGGSLEKMGAARRRNHPQGTLRKCRAGRVAGSYRGTSGC